jgi:ElaB/YqjD/DUF883 family membrane-anchored ribosome-binding protein
MDRISSDKLMQDIHTVVVDAEDLLKATAGQTGERVEKIRARATESLRVAREELGAFGASLNGKVRENPWTAAGVAAGAGLLIGLLIGRRS